MDSASSHGILYAVRSQRVFHLDHRIDSTLDDKISAPSPSDLTGQAPSGERAPGVGSAMAFLVTLRCAASRFFHIGAD
ncbi:hypothetical protein VTI28DRAFT_698 [Corynascus sepedonium]